MRDLVFDINAIEDIIWWQKNNQKLATKILKIILEIEKDPFSGIGKPEPLKYELTGCWSRRINAEHRIVYHVSGTQIKILQCKYHY